MGRFKFALCAGAAALLLSGCERPSAVAGLDQETPATDAPRAADASRGNEAGAAVDHRQEAVPQVDGRPMWSASRRYSAQENAERAFARNGEAFGARDLDDFVRKAHAFVGHPPKDALTLKRANGDLLIYDATANVFAVATRDGAPRTMFKPDDGMAYWQEQVDREKSRAERAARNGEAEG
ncbi:MAG: hypothetical protein ACK4YQ_04495 [Phenylobacterium sp.]|uniref:hypothetical protein n=1 Tax=Phenylobacterium sp. TaxID=1871053 RepID=UPI00391C8313